MPEPGFATLDAVEEASLTALSRAALDKRSPLKWPILATAGLEGGAEARTVVLRRFDRPSRMAEFWTDGRSAKVAEIQKDRSATLHFFDRSKMIQMRARGNAALVTAGAVWENAFARARQVSLDDYSTERAPGAPLDEMEISRQVAMAENTFTVIEFAILQIDWLCLSRDGHKRALLDWQEGCVHSWLVP